MNSSLQNTSSLNPHPLQKDVSSESSCDLEVAVELERLHELRHQVAAQEQKLQSLRQQASKSDDCHNLLTAEQGVMKSLIFTKEKELALALMKVAELTSQLEQLRRGHADDTSNKSSQKRIECTGPLATGEAALYQKGYHEKTIPIRIIKESLHLRNNSTPCNVDENSNSDRERGARIIPIVMERRTASIPIAVVVEGKGYQTSVNVSSNTAVLSKNFNASVQNARDTFHMDTSSKSVFSSDNRTNNLSSNDTSENGVRSLTADLKDIKTDPKSEKKAENSAGSVTVHSDSSFVIECGSKKIENDKITPLQSSEVISVANNLSDGTKVQDGHNKLHVGEDSNCTGYLFRDLNAKKTAAVMNSSSFDKKENGFSVSADERDISRTAAVTNSSSFDKKENGFSVFANEHDNPNTKAVTFEKINDSKILNFTSGETNGSTLKMFSPSNKSFSDFSLSAQLVQPVRDCFSSRNQAVPMARWDSGSPLTTQNQPLADVGKLAIKNDRARFFMDMVREDDFSMGSSPPLLESIRGRGSVEVKPSHSSAASATTSRGRSSSSAIMSRFAPQPYGRSKSVDSGSLRVPMMAVHGTLRREQSPELVGVDKRTVSSCTVTPLSEPNSHLFSSRTILQLQTVTSLPVQTVATRATQDMQEIAAVPWVHVPDKEVTLSATGIATSQLSTVPSYVIPTVSSLLSYSQKKNINAASLEKPVPEFRHTLSKTTALEKAVGDSEIPMTKAVTAQSLINPSVTVLGKMESNETSLSNTATGSTSPSAPSHLVMSTLSGVVSFGSVPLTAATSTAVSRSLKTEVSTPLTELEFSESRLAAGSDTTAVVSCTKSLASAVVFPSLFSNASMLSNPKLSPFTSMPVGAKVLKQDSLTTEPLSAGFRTVSDVTQSTSLPVASLAISESTTGTIPKVWPSVSKAEDLQSAEEMADTPWDSNVKRLANIFAMTIGGTVKNKVNLRSSRSKVSDYAAGTNNCSEVADVSNRDVLSASAKRTEHSKKELPLVGIAEGKFSAMSSANVSASIVDVDKFSPSASRQTVSPCVQQINVSTMEPSHSKTHSPSQLSPDITRMHHYKVNSLEQSKIDTSADSVSTALSVLLQNNSSGHSSPVRPSRLRTTISSAYRRKLGSGTLDNYSQNMTLLYGDCTTKKDDVTSSGVQDSSIESVASPPVFEAPLFEDLPRILALDTLDGMPFYPRIGSHMVCCENEISGEDTRDSNVNDQPDSCNESLKIGDVELTVIANPVQVADLVQLDSADAVAPSTLASFSPADDLVASYIDDPVTGVSDRFISETPARPLSRRLFGKDGKPQRRVTFDPVSLLLNAALEGEKDLVIDVVNKMGNPNHKTENGLSALHNAVCSGHLDVVRYLVAFGCDVNAIDNDGWTPLHCAASSNNLDLMRILVENGASILPMTISDRETPVQKCSRNLPGHEEAVRYLTDVARNLGVEKDGWVYATSNFANVCSDELILHDGDRLKVLRRGDESETEWWWARDEKNAEGYVPQSLLALFPRIHPKWLK